MKTLSVSEAKRSLGRIADEAFEGETILISRKSKYLILQEYHLPEPIPMRPDGYFEDCYDAQDATKSNKLASKGPRKIVL